MSNDVIRELQIVQKMLSALLKHQGLSQWCDCYAVGQNDGGPYVALFNSKAAFRIGVVYSEKFKKLPDYIDTSDPAGEISTERARVEKSGQLRSCPGFLFTRFKLNPEDPQDKWRFGDVLFASSAPAQAAPPAPAPEPTPQPEPADDHPWRASVSEPPTFSGPNEAIRWGVDTGIFANYAASKSAYERIKGIQLPRSAKEMFAAWVAHVQELARAQVAA